MKVAAGKLTAFWESRVFMGLCFLAAVAATAFSAELYLIPVFVILFDIIFVTDDNFLDALLPILLLNAMAMRTEDWTTVLLQFVWLVVPTAVSIVLHFVLYPKKWNHGDYLWGICAVSAALLLGGIGSISAKEYFDPYTSLYYIFLSGVGMIGFYFAMRNYNRSSEKYRMEDRFFTILLLVAYYCAFSLLFARWQQHVAFDTFHVRAWHNDSCVMILYAFPAPFYFAVKKNYWAFLLALPLIGGIFAGNSLAAVFVAALLVAVGFVYLWVYRKDKRLCSGLAMAIGIIAVALLAWRYGLFSGDAIVSFFTEEEHGRIEKWRQFLNYFADHPLFGAGMGVQDREIATMAMEWAHNWVLQIFGSMGIVGAVAYGYQLFLRARLIFRKRDPARMAMGMVFLGIFLVSMLQPGEFCPMPHGMMVTLVFVLLEIRDENTENENLCEKNDAIS